MSKVIYNLSFYFQIIAFGITMYYLIISTFGLYKKKQITHYKLPETRFAILIAAHNEELVIGKIIESLNNLDYPRSLYDIFVIADNCTDNTAKIALGRDVYVYERINEVKRGKGYALEWMFSKFNSIEKKYDAYVIFDADNLASRNFLLEMNNKMMEGYKVVQGYLDSKNPHDTWISESYSISFWTSNRLFQYPRAKLGLSNQIGGTGFCIATDILGELGWGVTCLTEDLEFTCKMVLHGYRVGWAHDAIVYDEKPLTLKQSWSQRKRWMQGFADVSSRYFFKLIRRAFTRGDFVAFDCALYTIQPFVILVLSLSTIITFLQNNTKGLNIYVIRELFDGVPIGWYIYSLFQFIFTPYVMMLENKLSKTIFGYISLYSMNVLIFGVIFNSDSSFATILLGNILFLICITAIILYDGGKQSLKIFLCYIFYSVYTLTWLPITIQGILNKNKKEWIHTKHTRQIGINEIEEIDEGSAA